MGNITDVRGTANIETSAPARAKTDSEATHWLL